MCVKKFTIIIKIYDFFKTIIFKIYSKCYILKKLKINKIFSILGHWALKIFAGPNGPKIKNFITGRAGPEK